MKSVQLNFSWYSKLCPGIYNDARAFYVPAEYGCRNKLKHDQQHKQRDINTCNKISYLHRHLCYFVQIWYDDIN